MTGIAEGFLSPLREKGISGDKEREV